EVRRLSNRGTIAFVSRMSALDDRETRSMKCILIAAAAAALLVGCGPDVDPALVMVDRVDHMPPDERPSDGTARKSWAS
ncbi:MAG: hypothetical protein ACE5EV_08145, partial [Gaiellales bacterium]